MLRLRSIVQDVASARLIWSALAILLTLTACRTEYATEDGKQYVAAYYEKAEYRIPMRDGALLHTVVYRPRDRSRPYPFLLSRTPYSAGPYGDEVASKLGPNPLLMRKGYIFVKQDVRGTYMSEGTFVNMRPHNPNKAGEQDVDESSDTYDTIEWLLANIEGHSGKVGMWGISYPGFYATAGAIDSHPALLAVSPQAPIADWFWDDMHRHGAFTLALAFRFFATFGKARDGLVSERADPFDFKTPDGYQFYLDMGPLSEANEKYLNGEIEFWNQIAAHPNYDEFWQARNLLPHLRNIKAAVLTVGGWYDSEDLYGPLHVYRSIEANNQGIDNSLVMGPWPHGGWGRSDGERLGEVEFGAKTGVEYREHVEFGFFEHYLKDAPAPDLPEALVFETGVNRWRGFDAWPPPRRDARLYLREDGALAFEPPSGIGEASVPVPEAVSPTRVRGSDEYAAGTPGAASKPPHLAHAHDAYVSDPARPVPYTAEISNRWSKSFFIEDQRFSTRRPDVLVYVSEPLEEDLTIGGPLRADFWVSTSGTDADFVAKVIDVYPGELREADGGLSDMGNFHQLVRAEAFRGRFRQSYEQPEPFESDRITKLSFALWDVLHTFRKGHRIMVQVQSSWFPFIDRNPQRYVPNIFEAEPDDFITATHRVYRSPRYPSSISIGVIDTPYGQSLPPVELVSDSAQ